MGPRLLRRMLLIRRFEERCLELYSQAAIRGFLHVYIGEEAVAVGVLDVLEPDDAVVSTYRKYGHALARGLDPHRVMAEMFARTEGYSRGRGGSMHLFDTAARFFGGNAIAGGGLLPALGLALADAIRGGAGRVTACFFGEGAVAENEFHETANLAALWRLPLLFCCENNLYATGAASPRPQAQADLALKAAAHEIPSWSVDGMDVLAVRAAASRAVDAVRSGGGPHFLELRTYRLRTHSMCDPRQCQGRDEVRQWQRHDPIPALAGQLRESGTLGNNDLADLDRTVAADVDAAVAFAEASSLEPVQELTRFVYADPTERTTTAPGPREGGQR